MSNADYPLIIIGAGASGLGASEQATKQGIKHIILEASHRIGGRGLTEYLAGNIPVDLGCHWMHCADLNPYVKWADKLGFTYEKGKISNRDAMFFDNKWLSDKQLKQYENYNRNCELSIRSAYQTDPSKSILDCIDSSSTWAQNYFYWCSLVHSNDVDCVSIRDVIEFDETFQDYPVQQGFGALICAQGANAPVKLNTEVQAIDRSRKLIKITTNKGTLTANKVLVTVSTGVLAADTIKFTPSLPEFKQRAIHNIVMGNSNYLFFHIDPHVIDKDAGESIYYQKGDLSFNIRIKPFSTPCVFTSTGGRFAWWLEKQGPDAARDLFASSLCEIFGHNIQSHLKEFKSSAWGFDPWIRGAYASHQPGTENLRSSLAVPIDAALYFAGEATSPNFMNTAHGAYLSGIDTVNMMRIT